MRRGGQHSIFAITVLCKKSSRKNARTPQILVMCCGWKILWKLLEIRKWSRGLKFLINQIFTGQKNLSRGQQQQQQTRSSSSVFQWLNHIFHPIIELKTECYWRLTRCWKECDFQFRNPNQAQVLTNNMMTTTSTGSSSGHGQHGAAKHRHPAHTGQTSQEMADTPDPSTEGYR